MSKGLIIISLVAIFLLNIISCETPETLPPNDSEVFLKLYGGSGNHVGVDMLKVPDGYFLLGNHINLSNRSKIFLVRTDERGNELWSKTFGGGFGAEAKSMDLDLNNNLIISSTVSASSGDKNVMFLQVDQQGNKIDSAVYGTPNNDEIAGQVIAASDGGYLMIGTTWEFDINLDEPGRINKIQILRTVPNGLDTLGEQVWEKFHGQGNRDFGIGLVERNGTYYCYGYSDSENTGSNSLGGFNLLFFGVNSVGTPSDPGFYGTNDDPGTPKDQVAKKLLPLDQGFVLLGETINGTTNSVFVSRVSDQLTEEQKFIVNSSTNISPNAIFDTGLSYLVLGSNIISNSDNNISLTNIDKSGNIIWQSFFGAEQTIDIAGFGIEQTEDGGFSFIGTLDLENQTKMCLIKVNRNGELTP